MKRFVTISWFFGVFVLWLSASWVRAQEPPADPTQETNVIKETLAKIRDIEQLDKYIDENTTLKQTNQQLQQQIAQLTQQVAQLTEELRVENERLKKQLLQMPTFEVKSKVVTSDSDMAVLKSGDRHFRIRTEMELSVPVSDGVWILMQVQEISKDLIQLHFPELDRTIYLYD